MDIARPRKLVVDPAHVEPRLTSNYPEPYRSRIAGRAKRPLGGALGLSRFGVNLTTIPPGGQSALRHWHASQDEFIYILSGELSLVTDAGEQRLVAGMAAGFPSGQRDAHHLVNRSQQEATYLEVGDRSADDAVSYPDDDIDARLHEGRWKFFHKNGTPYYRPSRHVMTSGSLAAVTSCYDVRVLSLERT